MRNLGKQQSGFTLVEMIIVIVITGIIGGIVAMFIRAPVQGYVDSARRAELTDIADTAVRRMARDVRTAVPNSIRLNNCGTTPCAEFLPTKDGGRWRANSPGNVLVFDSTVAPCTGTQVGSTTFDIVGSNIPITVNTDYLVAGSIQSDGMPPYDTTSAGVLRKITGYVYPAITMATVLPCWAEYPSQRFDVVDGTQQAVTYSCEGTLGTLDANQNGQASLVRHSLYGFRAGAQSTLPAGTSAILANNVSDCAIDYDPVNQRFGLLAVRLTLTSGGESVSLYNEIHVNNAP